MVAVDSQGRTSAPPRSSALAYDAKPPAAPSASPPPARAGSVTLTWTANGEADLAGYEVFRAASPNGPFVQVDAGVQKGTSFLDAAAPVGVTSYYKAVRGQHLRRISRRHRPPQRHGPPRPRAPAMPANLAAHRRPHPRRVAHLVRLADGGLGRLQRLPLLQPARAVREAEPQAADRPPLPRRREVPM